VLKRKANDQVIESSIDKKRKIFKSTARNADNGEKSKNDILIIDTEEVEMLL
jgi:hypothetical protein